MRAKAGVTASFLNLIPFIYLPTSIFFSLWLSSPFFFSLSCSPSIFVDVLVSLLPSFLTFKCQPVFYLLRLPLTLTCFIFLPPPHVHFISPLVCHDYQVNITLTKQLNSLDNCSKPLLGDHVTDAVPQSVFRLNLELFDAKLISVLQLQKYKIQ